MLCLTGKPAPHAGPANQRPMLNRQTSSPCWTSKPVPYAGPANQRPMLNRQTSGPCWTSKPAPYAGPANQRPMLNRQTSAPCWTSKPAPHAEPANQRPMLDQQTSALCWTSKPAPHAGPACIPYAGDQRCWIFLQGTIRHFFSGLRSGEMNPDGNIHGHLQPPPTQPTSSSFHPVAQDWLPTKEIDIRN